MTEQDKRWNANELTLYACNNGELYRSMIVPMVRNLAKKYARGTFDKDKAREWFYKVAHEASKMYMREFPNDGEEYGHCFPPVVKKRAACGILNYFMENIKKGDL